MSNLHLHRQKHNWVVVVVVMGCVDDELQCICILNCILLTTTQLSLINLLTRVLRGKE